MTDDALTMIAAQAFQAAMGDGPICHEEHERCKADRDAWKRRCESAEIDLTAARAVLREVECHAHECPRCYGPETFDGAKNEWYVAHKPGCALDACLPKETK